MANISPELRAAIDTAKARINVDSYYDKAMNHSLKGNAQGFWGGTVLGMATGAIGGGLVWAALAAASITGGIVGWPLVLGLAGIGGTMGGATGARLGGDAGSMAGVMAEKERRERADKLEQEILASPQKQAEAIAAYRVDPVVEKSDTVYEAFATSKKSGGGWGKLINWKTMAITVAVCVAASLVLFGGAFALGGGLATGTAVSGLGGALGLTSANLFPIAAGTGAAMGVGFGINYPMLFSAFSHHTADLLGGKIVRGERAPHIKTAREMEQEAIQHRGTSRRSPPIQVVRIAADEIASDMPQAQVSDVVSADRLQAAEQQITA
jgi:hypothetical protein